MCLVTVYVQYSTVDRNWDFINFVTLAHITQDSPEMKHVAVLWETDIVNIYFAFVPQM